MVLQESLNQSRGKKSLVPADNHPNKKSLLATKNENGKKRRGPGRRRIVHTSDDSSEDSDNEAIALGDLGSKKIYLREKRKKREKKRVRRGEPKKPKAEKRREDGGPKKKGRPKKKDSDEESEESDSTFKGSSDDDDQVGKAIPKRSLLANKRRRTGPCDIPTSIPNAFGGDDGDSTRGQSHPSTPAFGYTPASSSNAPVLRRSARFQVKQKIIDVAAAERKELFGEKWAYTTLGYGGPRTATKAKFNEIIRVSGLAMMKDNNRLVMESCVKTAIPNKKVSVVRGDLMITDPQLHAIHSKLCTAATHMLRR